MVIWRNIIENAKTTLDITIQFKTSANELARIKLTLAPGGSSLRSKNRRSFLLRGSGLSLSWWKGLSFSWKGPELWRCCNYMRHILCVLTFDMSLGYSQIPLNKRWRQSGTFHYHINFRENMYIFVSDLPDLCHYRNWINISIWMCKSNKKELFSWTLK